MLDLKTVAISRRPHSRISYASLNLVPITQPKLSSGKPERYGQRQSILPDLAPAKWLHADGQKVWRDAEILSPPESETNANAFVDRPGDVAPQSQCSEKVDIKIARDRNGQLNISPDLIVTLRRDD